jgi:hypothetical protein
MRSLIVVSFAFFISCMSSLPIFEDIQADKTRPIALVIDPPDAAPGDTVHVRYIGFSPDSANLTTHWTAALDFALGNYGGNAVEGHIVDLGPLMLPGYTPTDFYFVVPDSTLLFSTYLKGLAQAPWNPLHYSISAVDSMLKMAVKFGGSLPPSVAEIADMIGTKIKINVHINAEFSLDAYKYMTIRYTHDLKADSANVNRNPNLRWIAVYDVPKAKVYSYDSVAKYSPYVKYLYYNQKYADTNRVWDTIEIDSGHTYYLVADSGINAGDTDMQTYSYVSLISGSTITTKENYYYQWFYKDLDYRSPMVYDSLIMFSEGNMLGNATRFLTPVDTAMHRFAFYCVVRDVRLDFEAVGESEYQVTGYFKYTDAYARDPHNQ